MAEETLQERYLRELFDPRASLSPREVAAREEIAHLREQLEKKQAKKPGKKADKEQS